MFKKKGLAFRISISLLSVGSLVMFVILYYNYSISRNLALQDAKNDVQKLTELTVARIENVLQSVENVPINLASVIQNRDTVMFVGTRVVVEEVLLNNSLIYGASIAFAPRIEGTDTFYFAPYLYNVGDSIAFKDLANDEYRYTSKEWYTDARDSGAGGWSEPYFDQGGGEVLMATYTVPFYRDRGHGAVFAGVVTADLSLRGLQELIEGIKFFDSGSGFLISSKGNIVTWPDIDSSDQKYVYNIFDEVKSRGVVEVLEKMTAGETGIVSLRSIEAEFNRDRWICYASVPSVNWSLGILFLESELYEGIHILFIKLIAIGIAGFVILAFLIFYISRRFVKPIEKLAFATRKIGAGEFDFQVPSFRGNDEIAQLGKSFSIMQVQLRDYIRNLKETTAQKERMESELEIASNIQQQMLPVSEQIPGWEKVGLYGMLKPARLVGGDLYDFIVHDEYLYFAIGDVSGKGIPAALFMAKTLTLFRAKVSKGLPTDLIASEINRDLEENNAQSMFVTFFIGKLNMRTGELHYTNAGHNLPLLLSSGKEPVILPGTHGIPLGSMPGLDYGHDKTIIKQGEKIFLYTDGISEAVNTVDELFGEDRLSNILSDCMGLKPKEISNRIVSEIETFANGAEQADDITMLILEFS
jgi:sigma-B regulation protein RsbU (phosphoserine phosphatase)